MSRKANYSKDEKPSSTFRDIRRSGYMPSGQSLMNKSTYSKGLSERKMFSRKPIHWAFWNDFGIKHKFFHLFFFHILLKKICLKLLKFAVFFKSNELNLSINSFLN